MVELFATPGLSEGPERVSHALIPPVARPRAPHASQVERTPKGPDPLGRDWHPLCVTTASPVHTAPGRSVPVARGRARGELLSDRTPGLLCSGHPLTYDVSGAGRITPTSLRRTGRAPLDASGSTGPAPLLRVVSPLPFPGWWPGPRAGAARLDDAKRGVFRAVRDLRLTAAAKGEIADKHGSQKEIPVRRTLEARGPTSGTVRGQPPAGIFGGIAPALGCAREEGRKMWMREHGGLFWNSLSGRRRGGATARRRVPGRVDRGARLRHPRHGRLPI